MPKLRANGPYIWPTWLTALLAGESSCEWRAWFHAQHDGRSWVKIQDGNNFNLTQCYRRVENRIRWGHGCDYRSSLGPEALGPGVLGAHQLPRMA